MEGGFHGGADYLLVKAGSGLATLGVPDSAGIPADVARVTLTVPYNDLEAVKAVFQRPSEEYRGAHRRAHRRQHGLRAACAWLPGRPAWRSPDSTVPCSCSMRSSAAFRAGYGRAQGLFGVSPDLTTLGKIVGGGLAAWRLRRPSGDHVQRCPLGPVYQADAGGNPVAVQAGLATMRKLKAEGTYERLDALGARAEAAFLERARGPRWL